MKMNYYYAIECLIQFKERHNLILNKKNESVLKYLRSVELREDFESEEVPDVTMIASATKLPRAKIHTILYDSYMKLIETLYGHPHTVTKCVHAIYIYTYDDYKDSPNKEFREEEKKKYFWGEFSLPVTPRLGETIAIDFMDRDVKYTRGVVAEVYHEIGFSCQRIVLYVHPYKNYYWMWDKLKNEHIQNERWLNNIRGER